LQRAVAEDELAAHTPSPDMRRMQRIALVMLVISGTVNYLDRSALAIGNPEIREELGLNATQMGVLLSAFLVSYAFAQLPVGLLVDRVGPPNELKRTPAHHAFRESSAASAISSTERSRSECS
jgi:sugar phosphate permease